ncbi:hypothetical protein [Chryseobacterium sp. GP-SGM7]|uniref:hypothetical protein n=1 Tax=Chryseobacterium sp. GP-SGM7 TaxID=3411323 RepID=UPI003B93B7F8
MTTLEESIYQEITKKLKDAPKNILERVLGYIDGISEIKNADQLNKLKIQVNEDYADYKSGKTKLFTIEEAENNVENSISENEN